MGLGMLSFVSWIATTVLASERSVPAIGAKAVLFVANVAALGMVLVGVGPRRLEGQELAFALGTIAVLWVWDGLLILLGYWGAIVIVAGSAYLMVALRRRVLARPTASALQPEGSFAR